MIIDGLSLDLTGLDLYPGRINAHDHLEFALFPRLGNGPYPNAAAWARDIYHPDRSPIAEHLRVPKDVRLQWGGLRNLLAGVTTVSHHNPYEAIFDRDFPVRVVKHYGWAHSLAFEPDVKARFDATPPDAPFLIHAAEGTDRAAHEEIFELDRLGVLTERTVLIHAVAMTDESWNLVRTRGCSVILCPRSNCFTLGRTATVPDDIPCALGTDSPLTADGDFLDELRAFPTDLPDANILRLDPTDDFFAAPSPLAPPELVVIAGRIQLISPRLADPPSNFFPLEIDSRPPLYVRTNVSDLIRHTPLTEIRLAGRRVLTPHP